MIPKLNVKGKLIISTIRKFTKRSKIRYVPRNIRKFFVKFNFFMINT